LPLIFGECFNVLFVLNEADKPQRQFAVRRGPDHGVVVAVRVQAGIEAARRRVPRHIALRIIHFIALLSEHPYGRRRQVFLRLQALIFHITPREFLKDGPAYERVAGESLRECVIQIAVRLVFADDGVDRAEFLPVIDVVGKMFLCPADGQFYLYGNGIGPARQAVFRFVNQAEYGRRFLPVEDTELLVQQHQVVPGVRAADVIFLRILRTLLMNNGNFLNVLYACCDIGNDFLAYQRRLLFQVGSRGFCLGLNIIQMLFDFLYYLVFIPLFLFFLFEAHFFQALL